MKIFLPSIRAVGAARPGRLTVLAALLAGVCAPALASDVVISQVYGGGGNSGASYKNDFIELFNRSAAPVSLNNYSVQYTSAAGTGNWAVTALPNLVLQPGQYFLVQEAAGAGGTVSLPAPDVAVPAATALALSATAGKVALSNTVTALSGARPSGAAVLDLVGYGATASGFEGTAPAGGTANTTGVLRADDGCTDSDDNSKDFAVLAPTPRNTATLLRVCGQPVIKPLLASCPPSLALAAGAGGGANLSATDADSIVNGASITSPAVAGISLLNFMAAGTDGGNATVSLNIASTVPVGNYPVVVNFVNDSAQNASCAIAVSVQPLAPISHAIPQIQGSGAASAYANSVQTTEGVLTLKLPNGFFLQDQNGDGDPSTSDGLFIYTGAATNNAQPGDLVRVTGTVNAYQPVAAGTVFTELNNVTAVVTQSSGHSITPTIIDLPNANLPRYAGMLVQFGHALTVNGNEYLGTRGELILASGRLEVPTNRYASGTPEELALAAANAINQVVLSDGLLSAPSVIPYLDAGHTRRSGDTVQGLTGVIDFGSLGGGGYGYKVQPTVAPLFSEDNPRLALPVVAPGNVKVASANIENFFTTFTDGTDYMGNTKQGCALGGPGGTVTAGNCRGADNLAEFRRDLGKVVDELKALDADVYGLMEVQNNGETAITVLVNALNAATAPGTFAVVPPPALGTDAIRVAMIYKPATVALAGAALSDGAAINNRAPMAQTFQLLANGKKFSVIANHLKSKGGCPAGNGPDSDTGDGQGCWAATRVLQATQLVDTFVPLVVAAAGDPDVLIVGDMNSNGFENSINYITGKGYVNEIERFERPLGMAYSYVFNGQASYLDHALASATLNPRVAGVYEWHINSDEPSVIDFNIDGKPQDFYTDTPYRTSDHDPLLISLNLPATFSDVSASFHGITNGLVLNRALGRYGDTLVLTNIGNASLSGPFQVEFDGMTAGVTLANATGSHAGAPTITVSATLAPGASVAVPLSFINPAKGNIHYTNTIYSGTF
ncbi:ExeM/NucH family extracellular endonuclease [Rugamonas sp.]|uniref:ExeM/NucH family extracellular endonuclease n=1 Tax=Rugamonas sp. TaxID=1926287 RepID=UPI0025D83A16|nr:ExeM/NucH family extracellular endonuclease [Rugamonas sp.]